MLFHHGKEVKKRVKVSSRQHLPALQAVCLSFDILIKKFAMATSGKPISRLKVCCALHDIQFPRQAQICKSSSRITVANVLGTAAVQKNRYRRRILISEWLIIAQIQLRRSAAEKEPTISQSLESSIITEGFPGRRYRCAYSVELGTERLVVLQRFPDIRACGPHTTGAHGFPRMLWTTFTRAWCLGSQRRARSKGSQLVIAERGL